MNTIIGWFTRCYSGPFREELKPNLNSKSNSTEVCNTVIYVHHQHFKQWKMKWRIECAGLHCCHCVRGADKCDDQVTFVMAILGNSEDIKEFCSSSLNYKNQNLV